MKLKNLLEGIEAKGLTLSPDTEITGLRYDSRKVSPGDVFVCIKGYKTDGHRYIEDAVKGGAALIVTQEEWSGPCPSLKVDNTRAALSRMSANYFGRPSEKFKLIGVTGTNGKTTTTYMLKAILEEAGARVGLIGTNQHMIGERVLDSRNTTPESYELNEIFAQMVAEGVDHVVMEVSSHALALNRVDDLSFDIGIFTNITQDHLDFHKNMQDYLEAKSRLFSMCTAGVINRDDPMAEYILSNSTSHNFTYSIERNDADIMAKNLKLRSQSVEFEVLGMMGIDRIEMPIPGRFSVYNALGAITCALVLGVPFSVIQSALKNCSGVKGRLEVVPTGTDFTVLIDYAHTPDGLVNVLMALKGFAKGRIIALFGCGGDRDKGKRPKMGRAACEIADYCIITSDNPRSEDPDAIIADILEGIKGTKCPHSVISDRADAIEFALSMAKKDDIVVLCGKGHETYQILKDKTIHFDEREVVAERLEKLSQSDNREVLGK